MGKELSGVHPLLDNRAKWTVQSKIEKYNTAESFKAGVPDEVLLTPRNLLLNDGVNHLWNLVAGVGNKTTVNSAPFGSNSYIGVGDNNGTQAQPTAADTGLSAATNKLYMKMDDTFPISGDNQKIVFKSTFEPGTACFEWLEWTVANGNGNIKGPNFPENVIRLKATADEPMPDPVPQEGLQYEVGVEESAIVNLNHKVESMGKKYSSATWIISVEISLS